MQPAAQSFAPFFLRQAPVRLRVARFDADAPTNLLLLLNGQTEFIEKYFEVIDELRERGFSVIAFDWRGQGGSDRLLPDARKAHVADFSDYDQDLNCVIGEVVRPLAAKLPQAAKMKVRPVIMAHSMGGNILLRRLHEVPDEFSAAIICAPMLAIAERGMPWWVVQKISSFLNRAAPSTEFVWGMAERDQLKLPFALQVVTSDPKRYARTHAILEAHPDLRLNGPTWGWLEAAFRSMALIQTPGYAEAITTPSLVFGAGHDRVCETPVTRAFAARMPHARYVEIQGAEHEILMERDVFRDQLWAAFDNFAQKKAPAVSR